MTAISSPRVSTSATLFERALLGAASALDRFVAERLERRGEPGYRRAHDAQFAFIAGRDAAQARGVIGMLPK
jgi:hypothetical protein